MNAFHAKHKRFEEARALWGPGTLHAAHTEFFDEPSVTVDPGGARTESANKPGEKAT